MLDKDARKTAAHLSACALCNLRDIKMFIPIPRIILMPYRLIRLIYESLRKKGWSDEDKKVLKWLVMFKSVGILIFGSNSATL